jgi:transcription initiation factor TFIIE subunit alpha
MIKTKRAKRIASRKSVSRRTKTMKGKKPKSVRSVAIRQKVSEIKKPEKRKGKVNISIPAQADAKKAIDNLLINEKAVDYLKRNVSKRAVEVINMLGAPETDEGIAEMLNMKINAIRRILNIMHGYGITNYYVSKNVNGWLSFSWYINANKVPAFLEYIGSMDSGRAVADENCNDYFVCDSCYKNDKFIYTFDAAFEAGFKCNCGNNLERRDRVQVEKLLVEKNDEAERC